MSIIVQLGVACIGAGILYLLLERTSKKRKGRVAARPMQKPGLTYLKDIPKRKWCQGARGDLRVLGEEDFH
ncbi:MAG: hypothetical protein ACOYU3_07440 [Bacillota bacterium]